MSPVREMENVSMIGAARRAGLVSALTGGSFRFVLFGVRERRGRGGSEMMILL